MELRFGGRIFKPQLRMLGELAGVLKEEVYGPDMPIYFMYRDLYLSVKDREKAQERGLRYDITVIPPRSFGGEFVKTMGHYHPHPPGSDLTYPEVYEVLRGRAHYLLQRRHGERIADVVVVEAGEGEKVIIPPGYGHVTINPSLRVLRMANWVARSFESLYGPYKEMRGAAYYELTSGWVKNPRYGDLPPLRTVKAKGHPALGLAKREEIYGLIRSDPDRLAFLTRPQDFKELFQGLLE